MMKPTAEHDVYGLFAVYPSPVNSFPIIQAKQSLGGEEIDIDLEYEGTNYGNKDNLLAISPSWVNDVQSPFDLARIIKRYENFRSFKQDALKDTFAILENQCQQALDPDRFERTRPLIEEIHRLQQIRAAYKPKTRAEKRHPNKQPANADYYDFFSKHPEIHNQFDIRCHRFYYEEMIDDKEHPEIKMRSHFYDPHPELDYDQYHDFVLFMLEKIKERDRSWIEGEIDTAESEFEKAVELIKKTQADQGKVGLIGIHLSEPRRILEKEAGRIEDYTIDDYLQAKWNVLYWFN